MKGVAALTLIAADSVTAVLQPYLKHACNYP